MKEVSNYKECPKCGLRNKKMAASCTFCGYVFEEPAEPLSPYIEVLEKLSKMERVEIEKDELTKKIEFTIIKRETEEEESVPVDGDATDEDKHWTGQMEEVDFEEKEELEVGETPEEIVELVDSMIAEETGPLMDEETAAEQVLSPPNTFTEAEDHAVPERVFPDIPAGETGTIKTEVVSEAVPEKSPEMTGAGTVTESVMLSRNVSLNLSVVAPAGVGVILYLATLLMGVSGVIDPVIGWIAGIAGALLITAGAFRLYPSLFTDKKNLDGS